MEVTALNLARTLWAVCAAAASWVLTRGTPSASVTTARIEVSAFSLKGNLPAPQYYVRCGDGWYNTPVGEDIQ